MSINWYSVYQLHCHTSLCHRLLQKLRTGDKTFEQCFDQAPDLIFHAHGLSPGTLYSLRIVLYGQMIAFCNNSLTDIL